MVIPVKLKQFSLLLGDIILLYFSLFLTLVIRYGELTETIRRSHVTPFSILFAFSLIVFYIVGFYEMGSMKNTAEFGKRFGAALLINFAIAVTLFYFVPAFGITPKTNLFIFFSIMSGVIYTWRTWYNTLISAGVPAKRILLVGHNQVVEELVLHLKQNPQLGYEVKFWMREGLRDKEFGHLSQIILAHEVNLIVVPAHIKKNSMAARKIYKSLILGIEVSDVAEIYEAIFEKVPLGELEESWFLEHLAKGHTIYNAFRRPAEIALVLALAIFALPLAALIAAAIKLSSPGSAFFTQGRVGKNGTRFILWKFRTMVENAEPKGPKWAKPNDRRVTPLGKFLRKSHLDELPQLWNILRGELSLVGPRPERPEFTDTLEKEILFYELRELVTPGLTGLAQVNYRYGASLNDAYEKLQYDIYYLKHRGFLLDLKILAKTVKRFFVSAPGKKS